MKHKSTLFKTNTFIGTCPPKGGFPLSCYFQVRKLKGGNVWKIARKSKSLTSHNFIFKRNTSYLTSILFTRVKFTRVYQHVKITRQWESTLRVISLLQKVK